MGGTPAQGSVTGEGRSRDPAEDPPTVFGRREDSDRAGGPCGAKQASPRCAARRAWHQICTIGRSKEFLEAGKKRLVGDTTREATSTEVSDLRKENTHLKQLVAEMVLENRLLKKTVTASGSEDDTCD